jgi:zinc protease
MKMFRALCLLWSVCLAPLALAAPRIEHWVAPSGARVYFVENHDLPIFDVQLSFAAGSAYAAPDKAGVASLTSALLDLGVRGMDETQVANRLADLGARLSSGADMDRATVSLRTLSAADKRVPATDVLRAVVSSPQFPAEVFEREKARTVAALKDALTRPAAIAGQAFWMAMYPQHAYGRHATPESVAGLKPDDLARFHGRHYTAERAAVAIVGDLSRVQAEELAQYLTSGLPPAAGAPAALDAVTLPPTSERRIPHPAAQAHLLIGLPAIKRGDPDYFSLLVGNYTLGGGGFVSRLMREVREKRGFAYGVSSHFLPMVEAGPFQIGLQTKKEQADEALRVSREVLAGFLAAGPDADELQAAKQYLVGSFPLRLDSNRKLLDNVSVIGYYDLPLDYLDRYAENVEKVTAADILAAFGRHVKPEHLVTVVVGGE